MRKMLLYKPNSSQMKHMIIWKKYNNTKLRQNKYVKVKQANHAKKRESYKMKCK